MRKPSHQPRARRAGSYFSPLILLTSLALPAQNTATLATAEKGVIQPVSVDYGTLALPVRHLNVGQTSILTQNRRVKKLYLADPTVLDSYITDPRKITLIGKAPGTSAVLLWDEAGNARSYTISVDIDTAVLQASLHQLFPDEEINAEASGGKILLRGIVSTRAKADAAVKLAGEFTKEVVDCLVVESSKIKQVRLKVRFIEVDRTRLTQFGINIFGPGGSTAVGSGTTGQFPSTASLASTGSATSGSSTLASGAALTVSNALNFLFFDSKLGTGVTIQDLENRQLAQILAEPTIVTLSGQSAGFLAGGEFPFPVVQGSSGGATSITIQFRPYGVRLDFTPKVNPDGTIELKVVPEVSSLDYTNAVTISGYTIPAVATKHIDTQVVLHDGQSFAISGLLDKQTSDALSRTPGLSSIPVLGSLFKSKNVNLTTSELLVIVTPTIVDTSSEREPVTPKVSRPFLEAAPFDEGFPQAGKSSSQPTAERE